MAGHDKISKVKKEYMRACLLSFGTAIVALLGARVDGKLPGESSLGLAFLAVLAVIVGGSLYFRFREQMETEEADSKAPDPARLEKMTLLWYALSLVLAVGVVKEPIRLGLAGRSSEIGATGWGVSVIALGVGGYALWHLLGPLVFRRR